jgi:hypothetical protein
VSEGWHESLGIMVSVCVGFLYILNSSFVLFQCIVRSMKLMELYCSFFIVNFILVVCLLNSIRVSYMFFFLILYYKNTVYISEISDYLVFF